MPAAGAEGGGVAVNGFSIAVGIDTWAVPAATLGLPGLLVVLWVAAQTVGAVAWIPAVRRLGGKDEAAAR